MKRAGMSWLALLLAVSCGGSPTPPRETPPPATLSAHATALPAPTTCPASPNVAELLERHAKAFGTAKAVLASLPRVHRSEIVAGDKRGVREIVLDRTRSRKEESFAGLYFASGIDDTGPWDQVSGVITRLEPSEATALTAGAWLLRRGYLTDFVSGRDTAGCRVDERARVTIHYDLPALGSPEIELDWASAQITSSSFGLADGRRKSTNYEQWSDADAAGVRWPTTMTGVEPGGDTKLEAPVHVVKSAQGLACEGVDARVSSSKNCLAPPPQLLEVTWPASGVVHVPMQHYLGHLLVRARLGGHDTWALLDSGASQTVIDVSTPAGASFKPVLETTGAAATQNVRMGVGELDALDLGALALRHVPVVGAPVPALGVYGDRRPEVILGLSVFVGAAVRVDFAKSELVISRTSDALRKPSASAVPLGLWGAMLVSDVELDGVKATLQIDTGDDGGVDLRARWADQQGLLSGRPSIEYRNVAGAGTAATTRRLVRLGKVSLGPARYEGRLSKIDESTRDDSLAGLAGNDLLSRCAAVVFDAPNRKLWFEPPCDRAGQETLTGWRLVRKDSTERRDRPWVVDAIVPTGAAAKAGLEVGDRLLDVDGAPALLVAREKIDAAEHRAPGTKMLVTVERGADTKKLTMVLAPLLSP